MTLRDAWERNADAWLEWARAPGHDSYWRFHRDRFLALLPAPGRLTLDVGTGEGRLARDLKAGGHSVVGIDASPTLVRYARDADPSGDYRIADAGALPFDASAADLVVAFMSLMDVDDMPGAVREAARVLEPGGRLCIALVHPINSAGTFASQEPDSPFVIEESYFERRRYSDTVERDGLTMTFTSDHRPLEEFFAALESAGFLVERLCEIPDGTEPVTRPSQLRWRRVPLFVHIRAVKRAAAAEQIAARGG